MAKKKDSRERPLRICITRTRNYGWVTRAFLEGNTRWADYIIITDQMSTDATRSLIDEYNALHSQELKAKSQECVHRADIVIVDDHDMEFKENTGYKMAFMKGREIAAGRDAIYFALDIDEVMPANWMQTEDGMKILNSQAGDMFSIAWANIQPGNEMYDDVRMHWDGKYTAFHDNGMDWQECNDEFHASHLPYSSWDIPPYGVKDFPILHFGWYNPEWNKYKAKYHFMLNVHQHRATVITFYRTYGGVRKRFWEKKRQPNSCLKQIEKEWLFKDFDLFSLIDMKSEPIFVGYIQELLQEDGVEKYYCLDIWDKDMLRVAGLPADPRPFKWRMLHNYIHITSPYKRTLLIRAIDKVLKRLVG